MRMENHIASARIDQGGRHVRLRARSSDACNSARGRIAGCVMNGCADNMSGTSEVPELADSPLCKAQVGRGGPGAAISDETALGLKVLVLPLRHPVAPDHADNNGKEQCRHNDRFLGPDADGCIPIPQIE
jgi:hypothetical protein